MRTWRELFGLESGQITKVRVHVPIRQEHVAAVAKGFAFQREWVCACGAKLKIRTREDRAGGLSNYEVFPVGHSKAGQSMLPMSMLTWEGLAEERGWKVVDVVQCPACQLGMTVAEYKVYRRARG